MNKPSPRKSGVTLCAYVATLLSTAVIALGGIVQIGVLSV